MRIRNKVTGEIKEINPQNASQYGIGGVPQNASSNELINNIAGSVGGTVGQILGTPFDAVSGPAGTMVGGAAFGGAAQGGAEAIQEGMQGKFDLGKIAAQLGQGAAFGALPGGSEVKGMKLLAPLAENAYGRAAVRGVGGTAIGAGTQAIQNVEEGKNIGQNVLPAALETGAMNVATPEITDLLGKVFGFAGKTVPADIQKLISEGNLNVDNLIKNAHESMVGHNNLQYAYDKGILTPTHEFTTEGLNDAKMKADALSQKVESQLQNKLGDIMVKPNEFLNGLKEIPKKYGLTLSSPEGKQINNMIDYYMNKNAPSRGGSIVHAPQKDLLNTPISLSAVNEMKRVLGNMRDTGAHAKEMYSFLRDFIEKKSGKSADVANLNKEHRSLMDIKDNLQHNINAGNTPVKYDPASIQQMKDKIGKSLPGSAQALIGGAGAMAGAGVGALTHGLLGPIGAIAEPILGATMSHKMFENKTSQENLSHVLSSAYNKGVKPAKGVADFLQQILGRIPNALQ